MNPTEQCVFDGRTIHLTWVASSSYPSGTPISQVSGFCIDDKNHFLLVKNKREWAFPGGHPEKEESAEETLIREVREEANVSLDSYKLIGYMDVSDPDNDSGEGKNDIKLRYLAKICN
ncbi:MAG: NUDIX hydrolase, partial [Patescibacteria group bacterium]